MKNMEFRISKAELVKILSYTQNIVERKTSMPILANILITAAQGELRLLASNLEIIAIAKAAADITTPGKTTVNAKKFVDVVRELPEGMVHFTLEERERILIDCDKTKIRLVGEPADEYPEPESIGLAVSSQVNSNMLLEMISKTIYATSNDEARFNLSGVCFTNDKQGSEKLLKMTATDGNRLATIARPAANFEFDGSLIVPKKGLIELKHILETQEDPNIGIGFRDNYMIVDTANVKLSMRLIDGEFPDCRRAIPETRGALVTVNAGEFTSALKRALLMVDEKTKGVKFDFSENLLNISSSSPEMGDVNEEVSASFNGEPISVGYNARYVLDVAQSLKEDQNLCMEINGPKGPAKFYAEGDESYIAIVMPMRLS